jgi:hypothetical protein
MRSPCCLCVCASPLLTFECLNYENGMYIMAPEHVSMAYFINPSHQSVYPPIVARQQLGKNMTAQQ